MKKESYVDVIVISEIIKLMKLKARH